MSSTQSSGSDEFSKYSAFEDDAEVSNIDSVSFAKEIVASLSLADVDLLKEDKHRREYSWNEFLYALSAPISLGAIGWVVSSFVAVLHGSSLVVYLNFFISLLVAPYMIREQMPAQLLPSVRRKFDDARTEATKLQVRNEQLKGTVSRMQRQDYRLTAVEERFEDVCRRNDKDITKMKQLARKNASLKQKVKVQLAAKNLEELLTRMLSVEVDSEHRISEKKINEVVMLMKEFSGKTTFGAIDNEVIHEAVVTSLGKNIEVNVVDNHHSTADGREMPEEEPKMNIVHIPTYPSHEGEPNPEEAVAVSKRYENAMNMQLEPSGHTRTSVSSGTSGKPIDIEKLAFRNQQVAE